MAITAIRVIPSWPLFRAAIIFVIDVVVRGVFFLLILRLRRDISRYVRGNAGNIRRRVVSRCVNVVAFAAPVPTSRLPKDRTASSGGTCALRDGDAVLESKRCVLECHLARCDIYQ